MEVVYGEECVYTKYRVNLESAGSLGHIKVVVHSEFVLTCSSVSFNMIMLDCKPVREQL
jgi:hypothetical protein